MPSIGFRTLVMSCAKSEDIGLFSDCERADALGEEVAELLTVGKKRSVARMFNDNDALSGRVKIGKPSLHERCWGI